METPATTILRTALEHLPETDLRTLAEGSDEQVRAIATSILDNRVDLTLADLFLNTRKLVEHVQSKVHAYAESEQHAELNRVLVEVTAGLDAVTYDQPQICGRMLSSAELYLIADGLDLMDETGNTVAEHLANHFRNIAPRFL